MTEAELMEQVSSVCRRAADGDLEARISPAPETGDWNGLCRAINGLLDMVDSYVRESQAVLEYCSRHEFYRPILVRGLHGAYRGAAAVINRAALAMQENEHKLAQATAQRERLVDEVSQSAQAVAAACEQLTATSSEISKQLNDSAGLTEKAVSQSQLAQDASHLLAEDAGRIKNVVKLINDIAHQTNLLSLNATIEAARAGEQGKGFAVVANEVKSLSKSTATATGTIADQVQSMSSASGQVDSAIVLISESIQSLNRNVASIARAVEEQVTATREITRRMNSVSMSFSSISDGPSTP